MLAATTCRARSLSSKRHFATTVQNASSVADKKYKVAVVGAGPGGLSVASTISKMLGKDQVVIIDPAKYHYYQPLWTYVGGGLKDFKESQRPMASLIPDKADWIQDSVTGFEPDTNKLILGDGKTTVGYDFLVVAAGIQINWDQIKGLRESLGKDGVTSNYSPESVQKTYKFIQDFKGGNALFSYPNTPIKCPGAPTKIVFLAEETFRLSGVRDKSKVIYNSSLEKMYGFPHYAPVVDKLAQERNIIFNPKQELVEIQPDDRKAIFRNLTNTEQEELKAYDYDFLHVAPPQGPPTFIKNSKLADASGFVDVDKYTLRHNKYKNVFSLGDCSNLPTGKTAAAITVESGVLKTNLIADLEGKKIKEAEYDGYASCPLVVGRKELVLAEFSAYTGKPLETFPFDQRRVSALNQFINKEIIPKIYWNGLLTGRWKGPTAFREAMALFRSVE